MGLSLGYMLGRIGRRDGKYGIHCDETQSKKVMSMFLYQQETGGQGIR